MYWPDNATSKYKLILQFITVNSVGICIIFGRTDSHSRNTRFIPLPSPPSLQEWSRWHWLQWEMEWTNHSRANKRTRAHFSTNRTQLNLGTRQRRESGWWQAAWTPSTLSPIVIVIPSPSDVPLCMTTSRVFSHWLPQWPTTTQHVGTCWINGEMMLTGKNTVQLVTPTQDDCDFVKAFASWSNQTTSAQTVKRFWASEGRNASLLQWAPR